MTGSKFSLSVAVTGLRMVEMDASRENDAEVDSVGEVGLVSFCSGVSEGVSRNTLNDRAAMDDRQRGCKKLGKKYNIDEGEGEKKLDAHYCLQRGRRRR